jgi:polysaccharide export outer membrane protein
VWYERSCSKFKCAKLALQIYRESAVVIQTVDFRDGHVTLWTKIALLLTLGTNLAGCSFISESGPRTNAVFNSASIRLSESGDKPRQPYALVPLTAEVVARLSEPDAPLIFGRDLTNAPTPKVTLGVGDTLNITVFEASSGGLFIPKEAGTRPGNFVQLPPQQVDAGGTIDFPYGGRIQVSGQTPQQVQQTIRRRLSDRALDPQVVVSIGTRLAGEVSVSGDVMTSLRFSLEPGGERILGAIARAGGPKFPGYETKVFLQRGARSEVAVLSKIARDPSQNVELRPGDSIIVLHEPRYFLAFGALGVATSLSPINRRFTFGDTDLTLADAVAAAGGLQDDAANPRGLFLYRTMTRDGLRALGMAVPDDAPPVIPTIFAGDLADPSGYFVISRMPMHTEDIIFVSNAPATDLAKFLNIAASVTGSLYNATGATYNGRLINRP